MNLDTLLDVAMIVSGDNEHRWNEADELFLADNLGRMTDAEIGEALGRSEVAIHLRWSRDLRLPAPSKDPRYTTARGVARALGVDEHVATHWIDCGLLPGEKMAGGRLIRRVLKSDLVHFATDPQNWVWFRIERVSDVLLRRMIEERARFWGDEWWTTNQVAAHWGVDNKDVLRCIKFGRLKTARQARNRGGRNQGRWANWFVLRSEVVSVDLRRWKRNITAEPPS